MWEEGSRTVSTKRFAPGLKKVIHVNQHAIRRNNKTGEREPVLTTKTYKENVYGHEVEILGPTGELVAKVVYRPGKPLSCGARVWIETTCAVDVIEHDDVGAE